MCKMKRNLKNKKGWNNTHILKKKITQIIKFIIIICKLQSSNPILLKNDLNVLLLIKYIIFTMWIYTKKNSLVERWISWFLASLKVAANCEIIVVWIARHISVIYGCRTPYLLNELVTRQLFFYNCSVLGWLFILIQISFALSQKYRYN